MNGSQRGSCDTFHNSWRRQRQSTSISRSLFYGKWWWFWANVSVANLKSLHMLHMLKCNLESVEFWQEISSQEPSMCGWLVRTAYLHSLLRGLAFPRSFIIFIGYFDTSVYKWRASFQNYSSSTLENISVSVLLNILWEKSLHFWTWVTGCLSATVLLIDFNLAPTMTLLEEVSVIWNNGCFILKQTIISLL